MISAEDALMKLREQIQKKISDGKCSWNLQIEYIMTEISDLLEEIRKEKGES